MTFLGTGSAIPPNDRYQVSCTLRHPDGLIFFDCGEGTQYLLRKYRISTRKEIVICLSHLHSDHFLGLPGLLASFQLLNREEKIHIIGPKGTSILINNLIIANFIKVEYEIIIHELIPDQSYEGRGYSITCVKALHEAGGLSFIWKEVDRPGKVDIEKLNALGIPSGPLIGALQNGKSITWKNEIIKPDEYIGKSRRGRIIAYSGDTAPNEEFEKSIVPCDVLIHEATYPDGMDDLAIERSHTTITQAAHIAKRTKVGLLVLTHFSPRILDWENEYEKATNIFKSIKFAKEGLVINIPYVKN
ncbi:MAG: Ribonuclease Z [Candidatus Heimdallarchaeota archaeon LC_2]|nr:MAG: Ribonuclease Z [Candidatus Heimdallarchaeota archaeon LC_2]